VSGPFFAFLRSDISAAADAGKKRFLTLFFLARNFVSESSEGICSMNSGENDSQEGPHEIAFVGDLTDHAADLADKLLNVPPNAECTLYFDSPGGSPYTAVSLMSLILLRQLKATGIVSGECSSAALWPFAACQRRLVTQFSVLLFHPMKWQSDEHVQLAEANEWARHFGHLEQQMDTLLARLLAVSPAKLQEWIAPGRYVSGPEIAEAGLAELVDLLAFAPPLPAD
jgi:ATP-dependent protease ClpP protease subunit